jgi:hypothetical protein
MGNPLRGITGTGIVVVVVSATVVGATVEATVVGATVVDVGSADSPPPPHATRANPEKAIETANKRFEEIFTVPLVAQFVHQVVDECQTCGGKN